MKRRVNRFYRRRDFDLLISERPIISCIGAKSSPLTPVGLRTWVSGAITDRFVSDSGQHELTPPPENWSAPRQVGAHEIEISDWNVSSRTGLTGTN